MFISVMTGPRMRHVVQVILEWESFASLFHIYAKTESLQR